MADRILIDSTNPQVLLDAIAAKRTWHQLPISLAAYYVDGNFAATPTQIAQLSHALSPSQLVAITVFGTTAHAARVADSEPGNIDSVGAATWALSEHHQGHWPVIYCDRADKPKIIAACKTHGLTAGKEYHLWIATLDGSLLDIDGTKLRDQPGVVGIQFLGAQAAGIDVDVTLVTSAAWRPAAVIPPPPPPVAELDGIVVWTGTGALHQRGVISKDGGKTWA